MPTLQKMNSAYAALGSVKALHQALDSNHLMRRAHQRERAVGVVLNPRVAMPPAYFPCVFAQPVAPMTHGIRKSGFLAASLWGAGMTTSVMRYEAPLVVSGFLMSFAMNLGDPSFPRVFGQLLESNIRNNSRILNRVLSLSALSELLLLSEMFYGTGADLSDEPIALRTLSLHQIGLESGTELLRRVGVGGYLEHALKEQATASRGLESCAFMAAAIGVRLVLTPGRILNGSFIAVIALVGAAVGSAYEAGAQMHLAARLQWALARGLPAEVVPIAHAADGALEHPRNEGINRQYANEGGASDCLWELWLSAQFKTAAIGLEAVGRAASRAVNKGLDAIIARIA